jgi:hypothetical protein
MRTTKKVFVSSHVAAMTPAGGIGKADAVPSVGAPVTPKDFVPSKVVRGAKVQPPPDVIKAAPGAAKEIASSTTYASDFGSSAPDGATLATNIAFAAAWSAQYALAGSWLAYVKEQTRLAWLQANPQLDDLAPAFSYARTHNDAISTEYASTSKLFDARSQGAVKGAAVRASKKAAAKGAKTSQGSAAEPAPATAQNDVEPAVVASPSTTAAPANGAAKN